MSRIITRAFLVWLLIMAAESVHGLLRTLFLVEQVGDFAARQIGAIVGSAIILALAYVFSEWIGANDRRRLWVVGLMWLGLTLAFEFSLGRFALGYSWRRILEDYDVSRGGLLLLGILVMTVSPLAASTLRSRTLRKAPSQP